MYLYIILSDTGFYKRYSLIKQPLQKEAGSDHTYVDRWMDGWIDGWMDGWMDGWIDG